MCARRGAENKSDANVRSSNSEKKCMRPGPITRNGYLNFLREYRQKHCGLSVVETVRQGAAEWNKLSEAEKNKYTQMGCMIGNGRSTKCMRPGPLTNNGYLNFLRDFRREHCGLTAVETVRQGAAQWNKLSEEEKNKYTQMGCRIGPRQFRQRSRSRRSDSAPRRSRLMSRGRSRSRRSASAHHLSGKMRSRSRSRRNSLRRSRQSRTASHPRSMRRKSRNSSSQRRRVSTTKSRRSSSVPRRSSSMPKSRRSMVCHISPLHRTKRRSLKSAPASRMSMRKSRRSAVALSSRSRTAQNRPKSRRSIVCHRMTT